MWPFSSQTHSRTADNHKNRTRRGLRVEVLDDRCLPSGGVPDPTFGTGGQVDTAVGVSFSKAYAVATYPAAGTANDGKIVAVGQAVKSAKTGYSYMAVARYNADGSLDTTFGGTGVVMTTQGIAMGVAIQPDGKVVVVGTGMEVVRYNPNGSLDTSFGSKGVATVSFGPNATTTAYAVVLQPDGKIVLGGLNNPSHTTNEDVALARLSPSGALDTTFGSGGKVSAPWSSNIVSLTPRPVALAIDPNSPSTDPNGGKLVAVARGVAFQFTTTGTLDTSFGANHTGSVSTTPHVSPSVVVQPDDRIVVSGNYSTGIALDRLNPDGSLDGSFGNNGVVFTPFPLLDGFARSITLQADGKLLIGGSTFGNGTSSFIVARYGSGGILDQAFGTNGFAEGPTTAGGTEDGGIALEPDGRIVIAGWALNNSQQEFAVARFLVAGPRIGEFTCSPGSLVAGGDLTLTAADITGANPGATVAQVAFYADSDGDGVLTAADTLLGYVTQNPDGTWSLTISTAGWAAGTYTLFAQAQDTYLSLGDPAAVSIQLL